MKIAVESLSDTPQPHRFEADSAWWRRAMRAERGLPSELAEPFRIALEAHRIGEDLHLVGVLEGGLELECARCLARYRHGLREPFRLVLEPAGERLPADPEGAASLAAHGLALADDGEAGWFRGSEIHLGAYFMELVALALPVKPLCREDCPGLCPRCGAELSQGGCGCVETRSHSPFAVLARLRSGAGGTEGEI